MTKTVIENEPFLNTVNHPCLSALLSVLKPGQRDPPSRSLLSMYVYTYVLGIDHCHR